METAIVIDEPHNLNVIRPSARMLPLPGSGSSEFTRDDGIKLLQRIEACARISHRSENATTADSYDRFLRSVVLGHGDWSVTEHVSVTVDFLIDRGISHEIVRHRIASYTQESTRFVPYERKIPLSFVYPDPESEPHPAWLKVMRQSKVSYQELIADGWSPQLARSVLPNALSTRLIATADLRAWRHFFLMRTSKESHPQMRQVTVPLLEAFKATIPILFEDISPLASQSENLRKGE